LANSLNSLRDPFERGVLQKLRRVSRVFKAYQLPILAVFFLIGVALLVYNGAQFLKVAKTVSEAKLQPSPTIAWRDPGLAYPEPRLLEAGVEDVALPLLDQTYLTGRPEQLKMDWNRNGEILETMERYLKKGDVEAVMVLRRRYPGILNQQEGVTHPLGRFEQELSKAHVAEQSALGEFLKGNSKLVTQMDGSELDRVKRAMARSSPAHYQLLSRSLPSQLLLVYLNNIHVRASTDQDYIQALLKRMLFTPSLKERTAGQFYLQSSPQALLPYEGAELVYLHALAENVYAPILKEMVAEIQSLWNNGDDPTREWMTSLLGKPFCDWMQKIDVKRVSGLEWMQVVEKIYPEVRHFWALRMAKVFREKHQLQVLPADFYRNALMDILEKPINLQLFTERLLNHPTWRNSLQTFQHEEALSLLERLLVSVFCAESYEYISDDLRESLKEELELLKASDFNWDVLAHRFNLKTLIPPALLDLDVSEQLKLMQRDRAEGTKDWIELSPQELGKYFIEKSINHPTGRFRVAFQRLAKVWYKNRGLAWPGRPPS